MEQMPYVIPYIKNPKDRHFQTVGFSDDKVEVISKMKAFLELEAMLVPVLPELDYDKELAEAMVILIDTNVAMDFRHSKVKAVSPQEFFAVTELEGLNQS